MKKLAALFLALSLLLSVTALGVSAEGKVELSLWHYFGTDYE